MSCSWWRIPIHSGPLVGINCPPLTFQSLLTPSRPLSPYYIATMTSTISVFLIRNSYAEIFSSIRVTVCYHSGGAMKLNACILLLVHMVYLEPKHNSLLARHTHDWHDMYRLALYRGTWHNPLGNPLDNPPLPGSPSPVPESLLLTWNPSFACGAIPIHSGPRLFLYWPPPPHPFPSLSLVPNGSPFQICPLLRPHHELGFT